MHPDWLIPDWHARGVGAVMTTRRGGFSAEPFDSMNLRQGIGDNEKSVQSNLRLLAEAVGRTPVYLNQVHGAKVVRLTAMDAVPGAIVREADASVTTERGIACAVQVADCLPVLFAAPGAVGAAHAGWRGLASGVVEATLQAVCEAAGCQPAQVHTWLGACIGPKSFEVGADVLQAFGANPSAPTTYFKPHAPGKWLADLPGLARARLEQAGAGVEGGRWDTFLEANRFFSFRRDKTTGRMAALVWLT
ncbi:peptidoglycan editing factor PgeF [Piscinibacter terrae]|uniref:Purine nucleoside phosphorylase n=1 Tax=Piscinibacter terrae TaxID=2496871 RepID=A0A3N7HR84_9BURK|nr:peptidoglycan editing factor PgeF [Albitalea terrae]RQP24750.1 peptidoglycan editing factor PgeF [Albitalea terrae]